MFIAGTVLEIIVFIECVNLSTAKLPVPRSKPVSLRGVEKTMANYTQWVACHDCDLLQRRRPLDYGEIARCARCAALLYQRKRNSRDRTLMLTLTGLVLLVLANSFPFMTFKLEGRVQENTLITGVLELYSAGRWELAALVFGASILAPCLKLLGMLYVLLSLTFDRQSGKLAVVFRAIETLHPWAMMEVYMLGVFVAIVKLSQLATIVPGIALYSLAALILTNAAATAALDPSVVWKKLKVMSCI